MNNNQSVNTKPQTPSAATGSQAAAPAAAQRPTHQPVPPLTTRDPARVPEGLRRFAKATSPAARKFGREW
jgi:hypothetical protein